MNILEHIIAGHYPLDSKGRALVPVEHGPIMTIYATDHGSSFPICGRPPECTDAETWTKEGRSLYGNGDLLPPPPRKVEVKCKIKHDGGDFVVWDLSGVPNEGWRDGVEISFTGSYDEPWK